MEDLKERVFKLYDSGHSYTLEEYNELIKTCVDLNEMAGVVFLYDHMKSVKIEPTKETFGYISRLHSKTVTDNNKLDIKMLNALKPRRRIHKIMKGYEYTDNYNNALLHLDKVKKFLNENPEYKVYDKRGLINVIYKNCKIDKKDARYIVTNLKRTKFLNKREVDDFSNVEKYLKVNQKEYVAQRRISEFFPKNVAPTPFQNPF